MRDVWLDLTDVTLADEDTNSILTDNAKRAIQGNVATQLRNLVTKFATNASHGVNFWVRCASGNVLKILS